MATLTTHAVPLAGLRVDDKFVAASVGGDACQTGAGVLLLIKNSDTAAHTVTLATPGTVHGLAVADRVVDVPISGEATVPVTSDYRDSATGLAAITYDAAATLTVAVVRVAA